MPANTDTEVGIRELRTQLSDLVMEVAVEGHVVYVTNRGKRVAALVPLAVAKAGLDATPSPPTA
ncbi:type II toxin-antitoxin system Phd/YefM family antitoxin [Streptomyces anulatus]|uniref:type II toxin-antitoxin system Phd/YefM family antitoxin n=1 Tax=Streptomyces anulatus TaxID=1892 RepID=UPI0036CC58F9